MKTKILIVFGTRPEAIKMVPLYHEFKKHNQYFTTKICVTSQHKEMLNQVMDLFEIKPHINLKVMKKNQDLFILTSNILNKIRKIIKKEKPNIVFVHGDTTTAFVTALACFYENIKLAHIEAGLRTYNLNSPFPEEFNRQVISKIASYHFAPTITNKKNLMKEMVNPKTIFVTGNTVIDSLKWMKNKIDNNNLFRKKILHKLKKLIDLDLSSEKYILITGHRRENFGEGLLNICNAIKKLSKIYPDLKFIYPVHLNPNVYMPVTKLLGSSKNIYLIKPLSYENFVFLLSKCLFTMTDSGGIQEEAPSLGKSVLVMRNTSERPEAIKIGTSILVGSDQKQIVKNVRKIIDNKSTHSNKKIRKNPYGDGEACKKIVNLMMNLIKKK